MSGREPRVETATCGGGWRATSAATPIVNRERIRALELSTNAPTTPEMLFDSALELTHESGVTLRFHAEDALREWVALDLPAVKVAAAETGRERTWSVSGTATREETTSRRRRGRANRRR